MNSRMVRIILLVILRVQYNVQEKIDALSFTFGMGDGELLPRIYA